MKIFKPSAFCCHTSHYSSLLPSCGQNYCFCIDRFKFFYCKILISSKPTFHSFTSSSTPSLLPSSSTSFPLLSALPCPPLPCPCLPVFPLIDAVLLLFFSEACTDLVLRARQGRGQGKIVSPQSAAPRLLSRRAGRSLELVLPGQCAPGGAIIWRTMLLSDLEEVLILEV